MRHCWRRATGGARKSILCSSVGFSMEPKEEGTSAVLFPPLFPTTLPLLPSSLALLTLYPTGTRHQAVIPFSPFARQSVSFTVFSCGRSVGETSATRTREEREIVRPAAVERTIPEGYLLPSCVKCQAGRLEIFPGKLSRLVDWGKFGWLDKETTGLFSPLCIGPLVDRRRYPLEPVRNRSRFPAAESSRVNAFRRENTSERGFPKPGHVKSGFTLLQGRDVASVRLHCSAGQLDRRPGRRRFIIGSTGRSRRQRWIRFLTASLYQLVPCQAPRRSGSTAGRLDRPPQWIRKLGIGKEKKLTKIIIILNSIINPFGIFPPFLLVPLMSVFVPLSKHSSLSICCRWPSISYYCVRCVCRFTAEYESQKSVNESLAVSTTSIRSSLSTSTPI